MPSHVRKDRRKLTRTATLTPPQASVIPLNAVFLGILAKARERTLKFTDKRVKLTNEILQVRPWIHMSLDEYVWMDRLDVCVCVSSRPTDDYKRNPTKQPNHNTGHPLHQVLRVGGALPQAGRGGALAGQSVTGQP